MAVFEVISGAEKAQVFGAAAQNSRQVRIMGTLRHKTNKICVKNNDYRKLEFWGQIESGKRKVGALIFFL